jgi:exonuclease III
MVDSQTNSNTLSILEWNINGRSGHNTTSGNQYFIPDFVVSEILEEHSAPDIIVLVEFVGGKNWWSQKQELEKYYTLGWTGLSEQNGVLIGIKNKKDDKPKDVKDLKYIGISNNSKANPLPDFLQVDFQYNSIPVSIVGARIKVDDGGEKDRQNRYKQFQSLISCLHEIKHKRRVIVIGDFNIGSGFDDSGNWTYCKILNDLMSVKYQIKPDVCGIQDIFSWKCDKYKSGFAQDRLIASSGVEVQLDKNHYYDWSFGSKSLRYITQTARIFTILHRLILITRYLERILYYEV